MAVSADFASRLTAATTNTNVVGSEALTTVTGDISTLATDIASLVPQTNRAIQIGFEDRLIELAESLTCELLTSD